MVKIIPPQLLVNVSYVVCVWPCESLVIPTPKDDFVLYTYGVPTLSCYQLDCLPARVVDLKLVPRENPTNSILPLLMIADTLPYKNFLPMNSMHQTFSLMTFPCFLASTILLSVENNQNYPHSLWSSS